MVSKSIIKVRITGGDHSGLGWTLNPVTGALIREEVKRRRKPQQDAGRE